MPFYLDRMDYWIPTIIIKNNNELWDMQGMPVGLSCILQANLHITMSAVAAMEVADFNLFR